MVTARYVDPGALVAAGTSSTQSVQPMFDLADMRTMRVQVYVGQDDAADIEGRQSRSPSPSPTIRRHPIEAQVTRLAQGLDARTRTMLVEADVPNEPVRLYPGSYVTVRLRFPGRRTPLVPGDALAWRGDGLFVATPRCRQPGEAGRRSSRATTTVGGCRSSPASRAGSGWW